MIISFFHFNLYFIPYKNVLCKNHLKKFFNHYILNFLHHYLLNTGRNVKHYHEKSGVLRSTSYCSIIVLFCLTETKQDLFFVTSIVSILCLAILILTLDLSLESNGANWAKKSFELWVSNHSSGKYSRNLTLHPPC